MVPAEHDPDAPRNLLGRRDVRRGILGTASVRYILHVGDWRVARLVLDFCAYTRLWWEHIANPTTDHRRTINRCCWLRRTVQ